MNTVPCSSRQYDGPMRLCHRGYASVAPQNTREAIFAALDAGYEGVEIDIRMTRDGEIVVVHDSNLTALTLGHPTKSSNGIISEMTWDEVSMIELPFVNHLLKPFPLEGVRDEGAVYDIIRLLGQDEQHPYARDWNIDNRTAKIPRLDDLLTEACARYKNVIFEVEYKAGGMMPRLMPILSRPEIMDKCILFSGNPAYVDEIQRYAAQNGKPERLRFGANIRALDDRAKDFINRYDLYEVGLNDGFISKAEVEWLNCKGIEVFSNLGDYPEHWQTICRLGIAGFKTNYPAAFTAWYHDNY